MLLNFPGGPANHLPTQRRQFWFLVQEDSTCRWQQLSPCSSPHWVQRHHTQRLSPSPWTLTICPPSGSCSHPLMLHAPVPGRAPPSNTYSPLLNPHPPRPTVFPDTPWQAPVSVSWVPSTRPPIPASSPEPSPRVSRHHSPGALEDAPRDGPGRRWQRTRVWAQVLLTHSPGASTPGSLSTSHSPSKLETIHSICLILVTRWECSSHFPYH